MHKKHRSTTGTSSTPTRGLLLVLLMFLFLLLLWLLLLLTRAGGVTEATPAPQHPHPHPQSQEEEQEQEIDASQYLYYGDPVAEAVIHEYLMPLPRSSPNNNADDTLHAFLWTSSSASSLSSSSSSLSSIENKNKNNNSSSSTAHIVVFYAPWCPHCQHFRNHYVQFATQMRNLVVSSNHNHNNNNIPTIELHAVACPVHRALCRALGIRTYPKLYLYLPTTTTTTLHNHNNIPRTEGMISLDYSSLHPFDVLRRLGMAVQPQQTTHQPSSSRSTPNTGTSNDHNTTTTTTRIIRSTETERQHLSDHHHNEFKRTQADIYHDAYASLFFALQDSVYYTGKVSSLSSNNDHNHANNNTTSPQQKDNDQDGDDDALWTWLQVLHYSLPPTWVQAHTLISALRDQFDVMVTSPDAFRAILRQNYYGNDHPYDPPHPHHHDHDHEGEEAPMKVQWTPSCQKGNPYNGYTCGLWELFHIVTVGIVEWNQMLLATSTTRTSTTTTTTTSTNTDDDGEGGGGGDITTRNQKDLYVGTAEAALAIRDFVASFFGCEVCQVHFLQEFDACALDHCHRLVDDDDDDVHRRPFHAAWLQLPVWLWEMHNAVNVRLYNEKFIPPHHDPPSPFHDDDDSASQHDALWPSPQDCPTCWHADGSWDDRIIYQFLRLEYWPEDSISQEYRKLVFPNESNYDDEPQNTGVMGGGMMQHGFARRTIIALEGVTPMMMTIVRSPFLFIALLILLSFGVVLSFGVEWYAKRVQQGHRTGRQKEL